MLFCKEYLGLVGDRLDHGLVSSLEDCMQIIDGNYSAQSRVVHIADVK